METVVNEVHVQGALAADPEERSLPSGDELVVCRVVVPRTKVRTLPSGRRGASVDVVDLAGWSARVRRSMVRWQRGDEVEISGQLRRRFYKAGGQTMSRVEVEVSSARRVRRAASG